MAKHSAGILLYRYSDQQIEVLLVHPGGPFWKNKDTHGWSIPKGEFDPQTEDPEKAAHREFAEETGHEISAPLKPLAPFRASGKMIHAFLAEGDFDPGSLSSNSFEMEWPPRSGRKQSFPEVDKAAWFDLGTAREKLHKGLAPVVDLIREDLRK